MSERECRVHGELSEEHMYEQVDKLTSRHIAKCLDHLGSTIAPAQASSIKRSFRFLADDIKTLVTQGDTHDTDESKWNR